MIGFGSLASYAAALYHSTGRVAADALLVLAICATTWLVLLHFRAKYKSWARISFILWSGVPRECSSPMTVVAKSLQGLSVSHMTKQMAHTHVQIADDPLAVVMHETPAVSGESADTRGGRRHCEEG